MCGRYVLRTSSSELKRLFGFVEQPNLGPRYNIAPTQDAPVLRQRRQPAGERTLQNLRWGLVPGWAKDIRIGATLINIRSESVLGKFGDIFRRRRCLVPADGFYEWQGEGKEKVPYLITRRDEAPFAFAGIWDRWQPPVKAEEKPAPVDSFGILTTAANDLLRPLHERVPVILAEGDYARWLDPDAETENLAPLLAAPPNALLRATPIGPRINDWRNEDAGVMEAVGPALEWQA
jgi:putative SOS response-associated peptidase YedK